MATLFCIMLPKRYRVKKTTKRCVNFEMHLLTISEFDGESPAPRGKDGGLVVTRDLQSRMVLVGVRNII